MGRGGGGRVILAGCYREKRYMDAALLPSSAAELTSPVNYGSLNLQLAPVEIRLLRPILIIIVFVIITMKLLILDKI